jgi:hypothetical protein
MESNFSHQKLLIETEKCFDDESVAAYNDSWSHRVQISYLGEKYD